MGPVPLTDPPTSDQFVCLVREATGEFPDNPAATSISQPPDDFCRPSPERAVGYLDEAGTRIQQAADHLSRSGHPALSSYAETLANRLAEIADELREYRPTG